MFCLLEMFIGNVLAPVGLINNMSTVEEEGSSGKDGGCFLSEDRESNTDILITGVCDTVLQTC